MPTKTKKKRNKKYVKPVCTGWIGYGYIDYDNYRCYFDIEYDKTPDQSINLDPKFGDFIH